MTHTDPPPVDLTEAERTLLMAAWNRRARKPRVATQEELRAIILERGDHEELDLGPGYTALEARGWLVREDDRWTLSSAGILEAQRVLHDAMQEGFGEGLIKTATSPTYVEYCRRVYGADDFRFNMVDGEQLEKLLEVIALGPTERFVDLGCAVGALTELIADRTGAHGNGVDFAAPAIEFARRTHADKADRLVFSVGDLNRLELPSGSFDAAVAIDTLYFVDDVQQAVGDILGLLRPGGRFAAFFTVSHDADEAQPDLDVANTLLAKALDAHGVDWSAVEFTDNSRALWTRALEAAEALREAWEAEGNPQIWRSRDREARSMSAVYAEGRARRYLYWAAG